MDAKPAKRSKLMLNLPPTSVIVGFASSYEVDTRREPLGEGAFGTVRLCIDTATGKAYAAKILNPTKAKTADMCFEVEIMRELGTHAHIVGLVDSIDDTGSGGAWHLILTLATGGEVFERLVGSAEGHFSERDAAAVVRAIIISITTS